VGSATGDTIEAGRLAFGRRAWAEAYDALAPLAEELGAGDLERLADAAYWSGRLEEALAARERAYRAYAADDDKLRAAEVALRLAVEHISKGAFAVGGGWLAKGERALVGQPESLVHARLELTRSLSAWMLHGKLEEAHAHAQLAFELGERFGDPNVQAIALVAQGQTLLYRGELDAGLKLLDEASISALTGELDPFATCMVYCMTITGCQVVGDYGRARQWTDAASRWSDTIDVHGFPGACRVHRSEILWLGGDWDAAEQEVLAACNELGSYSVFTAGAGQYQIGEIRRRRGDFAAAEEAYRKAQELGRDPQPGQALLRLAQGKASEAVAALGRSLGPDRADPLLRARRLPAQVEVSLAVGELDAARRAADELAETTETFRVDGERTPLLEGALQLSRARIGLAAEEWEAAEHCARAALATWTKVGAPYEAAQARLLLGMAYEHQGDRDGARAEYQLAEETFTRLGAVLDARRVLELLGDAETRRTFVFTDIVDSTKLLEALGQEKWKKLLDRHDALLTGAIEEHGGDVIKHTGDGLFAAFDSSAAAVEASVQIQRALEDEFVTVRIGIHSGEALERGNDYTGRGVNVAARIGALAGGGEILVSTETLDGTAVAHPVSAPRAVDLKGFAEPVPIAAVDWR